MKEILLWPVRDGSLVTLGGGMAPRRIPVTNLQATGGGGDKNTNRAPAA